MNVYAKLLVGGILLLSVTVANGQEVNGILRVVKGDVQIKSGKTGQMVKARLGEKVFPKDTVITGKDARAKIVMVDNNEINVSPESQIEIQHYEFDPNAGKKEVLLNVIYGKVRSKVEQKYDGKTSKFQVKTPSAVAGVRGTDFMTSFSKADNSSSVVTFRGAVEFGTPGPNGSIANPVSVTPGKQASSVAGAAPSAPVNVPKDQLAKMDNETKAEGNSSGGSRTPSNSDSNGQKNKDNGSNNGNGNSSGNGNGSNNGNNSGNGSNSSGSGANGTSSSNNSGGTGNTASSSNASSSSGSTASSSATGGTDSSRSPAGLSPVSASLSSSAPGPTAGSGGGTLLQSDMAGHDTSSVFFPPPPPPPPVIPMVQPVTTPTVCTSCAQITQAGGNAKVKINLTVPGH